MFSPFVTGKGLTAYIPQNIVLWLGGSSKTFTLFRTGLVANPSTCHEAEFQIMSMPSNACRTFGPSRTSTRRPEPNSNSCRPARIVNEAFSDFISAISANPSSTHNLASSIIGLGPPFRPASMALVNCPKERIRWPRFQSLYSEMRWSK